MGCTAGRWEWRRRESDRNGGGEGGEGELVSGSDVKIRRGESFFGILGRRQGKPRWAYDPVVEAANDDAGGGRNVDGRKGGRGGSNN